MLMRALLVHIAHETAGAARTRHSLRPLYFRGRRLLANLGHFVPRECECVSWRDVSKRLRHPEVRALRRTCAVGRASKDESATDGPVVLRGAQERHLRMTGFRSGCLKFESGNTGSVIARSNATKRSIDPQRDYGLLRLARNDGRNHFAEALFRFPR